MLLLTIIYIGFVALGLPDSLFGTAWPVIQPQLEVPLSYAGFVTVTGSVGTIIASIMSDRLTSRFGAGLVTAVSVGMTAFALLGISLSTELWMLVFFAVPLGLGAGAVDAALNNFVALHFASKHMSWLHCFWGIGASISPYIMGFWLSKDSQWDRGYQTVAIVQMVLTAVLFVSLPLWKRAKNNVNESDDTEYVPKKLGEVLKLRGIKSVLFAFFAYCAVEGIAFSWTSSYLVMGRELSAELAAKFASLFYLGMTSSRLITGFFADRFGDKKMIRFGYIVMLAGIVAVILPVKLTAVCLAGIFIIGFGCGPVYPAVIHSTPSVFGKENSQAVVGIQMAFAYCGSTFTPPVFGIIANNISIKLYPVCLLLFAVIGFVAIERAHRCR